MAQDNSNVSLETKSLRQLLGLDLQIPDYQRIYSWEEDNVLRLLKDIMSAHGEYRMGSIILHKKGDKYDIIDGQQRLVTLSLVLYEMGDITSPLLSQHFESTEAMAYVAYNRYVIQNYLARHRVDEEHESNNLLDQLTFSVLLLDNTSIDLAYTFFSNENSRGAALSDFDLLKAHHLRYVYVDDQALHLASRWDKMLLDAQGDEKEQDHYRTLSLYIFRLRKWMRKHTWWDDEKYKVKKEYEAADILDDVPPFGEKFFFYEPIQGGTHFFAYVDHFVDLYRNFTRTEAYIAIHRNLEGETHWYYRDIIESLMFAYYLKFGNSYMEESTVLITRIISQFRYETRRVNAGKILQRTGDSEVVMMIDQATSPTFCLKEMANAIERIPLLDKNEILGNNNVRRRYFYKVMFFLAKLNCSVESINKYKVHIYE